MGSYRRYWLCRCRKIFSFLHQSRHCFVLGDGKTFSTSGEVIKGQFFCLERCSRHTVVQKGDLSEFKYFCVNCDFVFLWSVIKQWTLLKITFLSRSILKDLERRPWLWYPWLHWAAHLSVNPPVQLWWWGACPAAPKTKAQRLCRTYPCTSELCSEPTMPPTEPRPLANRAASTFPVVTLFPAVLLIRLAGGAN